MSFEFGSRWVDGVRIVERRRNPKRESDYIPLFSRSHADIERSNEDHIIELKALHNEIPEFFRETEEDK